MLKNMLKLCHNYAKYMVKQDGHTDLLTMTVFFHVLMGAVDEAAQGASRSVLEAWRGGERRITWQDTAASPSKSTSEGG